VYDTGSCRLVKFDESSVPSIQDKQRPTELRMNSVVIILVLDLNLFLRLKSKRAKYYLLTAVVWSRIIRI